MNSNYFDFSSNCLDSANESEDIVDVGDENELNEWDNSEVSSIGSDSDECSDTCSYADSDEDTDIDEEEVDDGEEDTDDEEDVDSDIVGGAVNTKIVNASFAKDIALETSDCPKYTKSITNDAVDERLHVDTSLSLKNTELLIKVKGNGEQEKLNDSIGSLGSLNEIVNSTGPCDLKALDNITDIHMAANFTSMADLGDVENHLEGHNDDSIDGMDANDLMEHQNVPFNQNIVAISKTVNLDVIMSSDGDSEDASGNRHFIDGKPNSEQNIFIGFNGPSNVILTSDGLSIAPHEIVEDSVDVGAEQVEEIPSSICVRPIPTSVKTINVDLPKDSTKMMLNKNSTYNFTNEAMHIHSNGIGYFSGNMKSNNHYKQRKRESPVMYNNNNKIIQKSPKQICDLTAMETVSNLRSILDDLERIANMDRSDVTISLVNISDEETPIGKDMAEHISTEEISTEKDSSEECGAEQISSTPGLIAEQSFIEENNIMQVNAEQIPPEPNTSEPIILEQTAIAAIDQPTVAQIVIEPKVIEQNVVEQSAIAQTAIAIELVETVETEEHIHPEKHTTISHPTESQDEQTIRVKSILNEWPQMKQFSIYLEKISVTDVSRQAGLKFHNPDEIVDVDDSQKNIDSIPKRRTRASNDTTETVKVVAKSRKRKVVKSIVVNMMNAAVNEPPKKVFVTTKADDSCKPMPIFDIGQFVDVEEEIASNVIQVREKEIVVEDRNPKVVLKPIRKLDIQAVKSQSATHPPTLASTPAPKPKLTPTPMSTVPAKVIRNTTLILADLLCHICHTQFFRTNHFRKHMNSHSISETMSCDACAISFTRITELKRHMETEHSTIDDSCEECNLTFRNPLYLIQHRRVFHVDQSVTTRKCSICDARYTSRGDIIFHIMDSHVTHAFTCCTCNETFPTQLLIKDHMTNHSNDQLVLPANDRTYECYLCKRSLNSFRSLVDHFRIHSGRQRPMARAPKSAQPENQLFTCELCKRRFWRKDQLKNHLDTHDANDNANDSADELLDCGKCGQRCTNKGRFTRHMRTHDEVNFNCGECKQRFTTDAERRRHLLSHTKEVLYECDICQKTYQRKENLHKHQHIKHGYEFLTVKSLHKLPTNCEEQ